VPYLRQARSLVKDHFFNERLRRKVIAQLKLARAELIE